MAEGPKWAIEATAFWAAAAGVLISESFKQRFVLGWTTLDSSLDFWVLLTPRRRLYTDLLRAGWGALLSTNMSFALSPTKTGVGGFVFQLSRCFGALCHCTMRGNRVGWEHFFRSSFWGGIYRCPGAEGVDHVVL